jgi:hypothetical protein
MIKHVGIQVISEDIEGFYIGVLNGLRTSNRTIDKSIAGKIFNIQKDVKVSYVLCKNVEFELFVHEQKMPGSFQHLCLQVRNPKQIYQSAKSAGYQTIVRETEKNTSYFIKDKNNNFFEIVHTHF